MKTSRVSECVPHALKCRSRSISYSRIELKPAGWILGRNGSRNIPSPSARCLHAERSGRRRARSIAAIARLVVDISVSRGYRRRNLATSAPLVRQSNARALSPDSSSRRFLRTVRYAARSNCPPPSPWNCVKAKMALQPQDQARPGATRVTARRQFASRAVLPIWIRSIHQPPGGAASRASDKASENHVALQIGDSRGWRLFPMRKAPMCRPPRKNSLGMAIEDVQTLADFTIKLRLRAPHLYRRQLDELGSNR